MESEDKFLLSLWGMCLSAFVAVVFSGVFYYSYQLKTLAKAEDPMGLTCAYEVRSSLALNMCRDYFESKKGQ